jgi:hypothetical protein
MEFVLDKGFKTEHCIKSNPTFNIDTFKCYVENNAVLLTRRKFRVRRVQLT